MYIFSSRVISALCIFIFWLSVNEIPRVPSISHPPHDTDSYHIQIRSIRDIACHSPLVSIDIITTWVSSWTVPSTINDGQTDRRRFPGVPPGIRTLPIVPTVQRVPAGITSALGTDFRSISRSRYRPNKQRHCDHLRAFLSRVDSLSIEA